MGGGGTVCLSQQISSSQNQTGCVTVCWCEMTQAYGETGPSVIEVTIWYGFYWLRPSTRSHSPQWSRIVGETSLDVYHKRRRKKKTLLSPPPPKKINNGVMRCGREWGIERYKNGRQGREGRRNTELVVRYSLWWWDVGGGSHISRTSVSMSVCQSVSQSVSHKLGLRELSTYPLQLMLTQKHTHTKTLRLGSPREHSI